MKQGGGGTKKTRKKCTEESCFRGKNQEHTVFIRFSKQERWVWIDPSVSWTGDQKGGTPGIFTFVANFFYVLVPS